MFPHSQSSPIIPWIGGKRRLARRILARAPVHTCYVEAFAGGAAVFFTKAPSEVEVLNDVNGDLVSLYRVVQHHLEEFVRQFKWALSSRQIFEWQKSQPTAPLTDIQRAARFYYLQRLAFGGRVDGQNFGTATTARPGLNLLRIEEDLSQAHLRLQGCYIEHLEWHQAAVRYDRPATWHYWDPPYWETEGYGVPFPLEEYARMAELARTLDGSVLISVNDHPAMRAAFSGLHTEVVRLKYTVGGGAGLQADELLIWNDRLAAAAPAAPALTLF